ncbi:MAG: phosphatase PAP2 family protein [Candidatus Pacebacteria bacterium]|nr:phosphatase PAP2 family protein [Candidatus Paceibacterota bacterium]
MNFDQNLFHFINQFAGKNICLDSAAIFFAEYFQYVVVFLFSLFLIFRPRKNFKMVFSAILAAFFARFVFTDLIRYLFPRMRPFVENNINLLLPHNPNESSFPSGHAAFFFGLSAVVFYYNKKAGAAFFFASFLISISRVFIGIHWPLDILSGFAVGLLSASLILEFTKKFS